MAEVRVLLARKMCQSTLFFQSVDTNENGQLDRDEFRAAIKDMRRDGVPDSVCDALFSEFDIDHDGEISFEEYLSYMLRDTLHRNVSKAIDFVKKWDLDGTGEIELWEFRRAMCAMGMNGGDGFPTVQMIDDLFHEMDCDHSGSLNVDEIYTYLQTLHKRRPSSFPKPKARRMRGGDMPKLAAAKLDEEAAEKLQIAYLAPYGKRGRPAAEDAAAVGSGGHRSRPHLRNSGKADLTARFSKFDINTAQPEQSSSSRGSPSPTRPGRASPSPTRTKGGRGSPDLSPREETSPRRDRSHPMLRPPTRWVHPDNRVGVAARGWVPPDTLPSMRRDGGAASLPSLRPHNGSPTFARPAHQLGPAHAAPFY